jgi:membrane-bound ClpP family serine protease
MTENETKTIKSKTKPKINYREAIILWVGAAILLIIGTSTKSYVFEILAIMMIVFGYIIAMWDRIFSKTNNEEQKEETKKEEC